LATLAVLPQTLVFYEAPHRLRATLAELNVALGDRPAAACRELTKKFEEFVRGNITSLEQHFSLKAPRGEFTLVVGGASDDQLMQPNAEPVPELPIAAAVATLVEKGTNKKDAIRMVASERGLAKRLVYQAVLDAAK
jgi:16S rRNA (cytidine1402-2'-O)-methyltransferase